MLAFSMLVAGSFSLGGLAANEIAPIALNFVRFVLAAGFVAFMGWASGTMRRSDFEAPWRYVLLGGLFSVYFVLMFEALKTAPPVNTAVVFTLTPLLAAGFGWILLRQRLGAWSALALAIGGAGAVWVIFRGSFEAMRAFEVGRGEAIFFAGTVAHALYVPAARLWSRGASPFGFTLGILLGGALVQGIVGAPALMATDWAALPRVAWITIFYTAFLATSFTFTLVYFATLRLPSAKVMAYTYLTPSWVILWEIGLGQGLPPATVLAGVGLTILSLGILLGTPDRGGAPAA
ncbi:membrane protein [Pseudaestuariivita atlantica]|uniref:Membrane protein n=2 Tax=Pseudaestuariivita atlantica TaxID=1317121 RepID=A0A0L1JTC7_9RHOB|nr:membrane protein [Pseudaestuariivita atlantica]